jgi:hypothetical protein
MRSAKIDASDALARRSVAVMGNEGAAEDTGRRSKNDFSEIIGARARLKPGAEAARPAALTGLQPAYCA